MQILTGAIGLAVLSACASGQDYWSSTSATTWVGISGEFAIVNPLEENFSAWAGGAIYRPANIETRRDAGTHGARAEAGLIRGLCLGEGEGFIGPPRPIEIGVNLPKSFAASAYAGAEIGLFGGERAEGHGGSMASGAVRALATGTIEFEVMYNGMIDQPNWLGSGGRLRWGVAFWGDGLLLTPGNGWNATTVDAGTPASPDAELDILSRQFHWWGPGQPLDLMSEVWSIDVVEGGVYGYYAFAFADSGLAPAPGVMVVIASGVLAAGRRRR
jgi:hypothetical protein